ncbi:hypothetical protein HWV62_25084 [Athelia sp. TMB]|nr:hypothetical protein HWV62_25084 [Athelia sp. TMB]
MSSSPLRALDDSGSEWIDESVVNPDLSSVSLQDKWLGQRPRFLSSDMQPPSSLEEANCLMHLAHTKRAIYATTKKLSKKRAQEYKLRAHLYELQARRADVKLGEADLDIGRASFAVRNSGHFIHPSPRLALKRYGSITFRSRLRPQHEVLAVHLD